MSNFPASPAVPQQEAYQTGNPVSESAMYGFGGPLAYLLVNVGQVGDIVESMLPETAFQGLRDTTWILADGRSVAGSDYQALTGNSTVPDLRACYTRSCDNGGSSAGARGLDPNGPQNPGTYIQDTLPQHSHGYERGPFNAGISGSNTVFPTMTVPTAIQAPQTTGTSTVAGIAGGGTSTVVGNEVSVKTVYVNRFIKINAVP